MLAETAAGRINDPLAGPEGPAYSSHGLFLMSRKAATDA